jgi:hypothetical protein
MTDRLALILALCLAALVAANFVWGWELEIFLGRKLADAIDWLAFWR